MLNQDLFVLDNLLIISGSLVLSMSLVGYLYLRGYIFNKNNIESSDNNVVSYVDDVDSNIGSSTITSLSTKTINDRNNNDVETLSDYRTAIDSSVLIEDNLYLDKGIQTDLNNIIYKDKGSQCDILSSIKVNENILNNNITIINSEYHNKLYKIALDLLDKNELLRNEKELLLNKNILDVNTALGLSDKNKELLNDINVLLNENKVLLNKINLLTNKDMMDFAVSPIREVVVSHNEKLLLMVEEKLEKGYSTDVLSADGSVERDVFNVLNKSNIDQTKKWVDNIDILTTNSNIVDLYSSTVHSVDESFITNVPSFESDSVIYNIDDLKHRKEILDSLVKKGLLEITNMSDESKGKGKDIIIENIQSLSTGSGSASSLVSSSEVKQEVINTTIPVIKDVLDIITSST